MKNLTRRQNPTRPEFTEPEFKHLCKTLEPSLILKLHSIIELVKSDNKLNNFSSMFVEIRVSIVKQLIQSLNSNKIKKQNQISKNDVVLWGEEMEYVLKDVLKAEFELCKNVFDKFDRDIVFDCFVRIVSGSGFVDLVKVGDRVIEGKKDANKLLRLLDVFSVMDRLRGEFNGVFSCRGCEDVREVVRDVVRRVVDGACNILFELKDHVRVQGSKMGPVSGGCGGGGVGIGVHRFVKFVVGYCGMLVDDEYRYVLSKVVSIHQVWRNENGNEMVLSDVLGEIIDAIEDNLGAWCRSFEDRALSWFFLMNNYRYMHGFLDGKPLGDMMGGDWVGVFVRKMEKYEISYVNESWEKLPAILSEVGLMFFFPDRTVNEDLVKGILAEFNVVFEDLYRRQREWVLLDDGLREKVHELIVGTVIPPYRSYLRSYGELMGKRSHVKYSAVRLEAMLRMLFLPKMTTKSAAIKLKSSHSIGSGQRVPKHHHRVQQPKLSHPPMTTGFGVWIPCS